MKAVATSTPCRPTTSVRGSPLDPNPSPLRLLRKTPPKRPGKEPKGPGRSFRRCVSVPPPCPPPRMLTSGARACGVPPAWRRAGAAGQRRAGRGAAGGFNARCGAWLRPSVRPSGDAEAAACPPLPTGWRLSAARGGEGEAGRPRGSAAHARRGRTARLGGAERLGCAGGAFPDPHLKPPAGSDVPSSPAPIPSHPIPRSPLHLPGRLS